KPKERQLNQQEELQKLSLSLFLKHHNSEKHYNHHICHVIVQSSFPQSSTPQSTNLSKYTMFVVDRNKSSSDPSVSSKTYKTTTLEIYSHEPLNKHYLSTSFFHMDNNEKGMQKGKEVSPEMIPLPETPLPIRTPVKTKFTPEQKEAPLFEVEEQSNIEPDIQSKKVGATADIPISTNISKPPGNSEEGTFNSEKGEHEEGSEKERSIIPPITKQLPKIEVSSIKNIWSNNLFLRILVYIIAAFSSIPVLTLLGWTVVTATIIIGIAGIGIAIAESCALGCGSCVCFPVFGVLIFVAFLSALLGGLGYCSYSLLLSLLAFTGFSLGKNARERSEFLSQLSYENKFSSG
ncbi:12274_t:CDS:2, partial [Ambispora leptoticha]